MTTIKPAFLLFLSVSVLGLSNGCATLPNVSEKIAETSASREPPRIASAKGSVSPEQSRAIMERLKGSVDPTDILQRHNAVMESVSRSPLTKGNKVTLLVDGRVAYAAMFKAIENAGDHFELLKAGVKVYERRNALLHAKTAVIAMSGRRSALPTWTSGAF